MIVVDCEPPMTQFPAIIYSAYMNKIMLLSMRIIQVEMISSSKE